ncbi:ArsC family reductase [Rhizobium paknamense]|uniref:Arsenate reductase n=1 Tax=Rhizobium paknamense TaxID=1206817 RepID=A0ABU0IBC8_9HYPH|nr:ArsC family reductase [Rhizobium paknamense]MDQ0455534.1 arsenate reductase [Rhizobium paknamense]
MTTILYGIKTCDTMKKARAWLEAEGIAYEFHDYKLRGIDRASLAAWQDKVGWEVLLNRTGTTFRKLSEEARAGVDAEKALALMEAQPSMIKRPVLTQDGRIIVGFKPEQYAAFFGR